MGDFLDSKALHYAARRTAISDWLDGRQVDGDELLALAAYVAEHHPENTDAALRLSGEAGGFTVLDRAVIEEALVEDQIEFGDTLRIEEPDLIEILTAWADHPHPTDALMLDDGFDEGLDADAAFDVIDRHVEAATPVKPRTHLEKLLDARAREEFERDDPPEGRPRR